MGLDMGQGGDLPGIVQGAVGLDQHMHRESRA